MAHLSRLALCGLGQIKEPSSLPVSSSRHKKQASFPSSHVVPTNTLPWLTTGLPVVRRPSLATHLTFFVDCRSTSPALFSTAQSAQSGNLRSLLADILREACPHHSGQSLPLAAFAPAARSTPVQRIIILPHVIVSVPVSGPFRIMARQRAGFCQRPGTVVDTRQIGIVYDRSRPYAKPAWPQISAARKPGQSPFDSFSGRAWYNGWETSQYETRLTSIPNANISTVGVARLSRPLIKRAHDSQRRNQSQASCCISVLNSWGVS